VESKKGCSDVLCAPLEHLIVVEEEAVTELLPMRTPAGPIRGSADLGTHGNQVDGGPLYVSSRDQEGVVGQEFANLLDDARPDALLLQKLLQSRHLA
jgi:hypothetical protein